MMEKEQKIINGFCQKVKNLYDHLQPEEQDRVNTLVVTVKKFSKTNDFSMFETLISTVIGKEIRMIEDLPNDLFKVNTVHFAYYSKEEFEEELARQNKMEDLK